MKSNLDIGDPLSSFNPSWKSSGVLPINPGQSLVPNRVYSLPADLGNVHKIDKRVLAKAEKLSLHPNQEHMRFNIAKALVSHKPHSL